MLVQEKQGASQLNRINNILPDHIMFIKSQMQKGDFITTRDREVLINVAGSNLKHIVNIPNKGEEGYIKAWTDVYNYLLDYIETSISNACVENKYIQAAGNNWTVNGHNIIWPKFNSENADYAIGLLNILDEYKMVKENNIKKEEGISIKQSSVLLTPANEILLRTKNKLDKQKVKAKVAINKKDTPINKVDTSVDKVDTNPSENNEVLNIKKVSDGDILNKRDIEKLKDDITLLTCQDVAIPKEEEIFLKNYESCSYAGIKTGAFIYGHAIDEYMEVNELKRIIQLLDRCKDDFSKLVIYNIDNDYIKKCKNSDIKLLEYINIYNKILTKLENYGYNVMLSMNLQSGKVIDDINRRYSSQNEFDVIYMTIVRDLQDIDEEKSVIIVDPGNDYDIVDIKNNKILNKIETGSDKALAKVA